MEIAHAVDVKPLLRNSPAYINKSSSTSLRKSSILFRLSISVLRDFRRFLDHADSERSREQSEPHIWAGKLQSLTPETQTFDVT